MTILMGAYDTVIQGKVQEYGSRIRSSKSLADARYWLNSGIAAITEVAVDYGWSITDQIRAEEELKGYLLAWENANARYLAGDSTAPTTPGPSSPSPSAPGANNQPAPSGWLPAPVRLPEKKKVSAGVVVLAVAGTAVAGGVLYVLARRFLGGRRPYVPRSGYVT